MKWKTTITSGVYHYINTYNMSLRITKYELGNDSFFFFFFCKPAILRPSVVYRIIRVAFPRGTPKEPFTSNTMKRFDKSSCIIMIIIPSENCF